MAAHAVLLGDSIFDNRAYVGREPDVVAHLRAIVPPPWKASLLAVDGSRTVDLARQLTGLPEGASHLVVSIGGNDALMNTDLLRAAASSAAHALALFSERVERFERDYTTAIDGVLALGLPTTTCTIYNGNLDEAQAALARTALMLFNDVILRVAFQRRLSVIDLRLVCSSPSDYANPIEPSGRGGRKIAAAVARAVGAGGTGVPHSRVFAE